MNNIKPILLVFNPMITFPQETADLPISLRDEVFKRVEYVIWERMVPLVYHPIMRELDV